MYEAYKITLIKRNGEKRLWGFTKNKKDILWVIENALTDDTVKIRVRIENKNCNKSVDITNTKEKDYE